MNQAIQGMLQKYDCKTPQDYINALKEIIQEVALVGLWRSKFFDEVAFYGGTALRILFQLNRFSEDLDFTLMRSTQNFEMRPHLEAIKEELGSFGFQLEVAEKTKARTSAVQSAFLKGNTMTQLLQIGVPQQLFSGWHRHEQLKIKLEIDTDPPPGFDTTTHFLLQPIPCAIRVVAEQDLFAGKMHAILCRTWKNRVKGRDWYDLVWYVSKGIPIHLPHLEARMRQSGHYLESDGLSAEKFRQLLDEKINQVDFNDAKKDVAPFIRDPTNLDVWSKDFFHAVAKKIKIEF